MANSTTHLTTLTSAQASKEITVNQLFDAASPALMFGRKQSSTGLSWDYYGGYFWVNGGPVWVPNGTLTLSASQASICIEVSRAGTVYAVNGSTFTPGRFALYTVVTGASSVTSWTDMRQAGLKPDGLASVSMTSDANFTMTQGRAECQVLNVSSTVSLTATRDLIMPLMVAQYTIYNGTTGGQALRVLGATGAAVTIPNGLTAEVYCDGTNYRVVDLPLRTLRSAVSMASDANFTLTTTQAYSSILDVTSAVSLTAPRDIIVPLNVMQYTVYNGTTGGQSIRFIAASGTGITVANGMRAIIYCDGTNVVRVTADT